MTITTTPRLALTKDSNTELYSVERVNANADKIDANIGVIMCTSSTRPSTPYDGMQIYEKDTGLHGVWRADLSAWSIPRAGLYASSSRPTLGIYEGYTFYRTDYDWHEVYDGSVWRTVGAQTTSSLSNITNPKVGQTAILTTDYWEYRWNGSVWTAFRPTISPPNIIRRLNAASTPISASTNTRVTFDTIVGTAVDISHSSGQFTFSRSGWYQINCSVRLSTLTASYLWISQASIYDYNRGKTSGDGGLNLATSVSIPINAGEVWSAWIWCSGANNLVREVSTANDFPPYFSAVWLGPL